MASRSSATYPDRDSYRCGSTNAIREELLVTERSDRQSFLGPESTGLFANLRVAIVGLGGGGSHIAQQLAHIGIGNYLLVDPDRIEESNLNRLIGGLASDVSARQPKTTIAARLIEGVLPTAVVTSLKNRWQLVAEELRDCDIIFGCVDSFSERRQIEEAARRSMIPYIDIGMDVIGSSTGYSVVGQVALSMPGRACLRCMGIIRESDLADEAQRYGAAGGKPQVVWPNGVLASLAVGLAIQLVAPWHEGHVEHALLEYDGNRHTMTASTVLAELPHACQHFAGINSLGDPWFHLSRGSVIESSVASDTHEQFTT
jgi:molybdopterin-synthase adenylyltransferase